MMLQPLVSVIIPTFNRAGMLRRSTLSVLAQTFSDFELIILDNSSSDNTEAAVKEFSDPRIRYIRHAPLFVAEARNVGVKESRGRYIAFLDDDDEWLPSKLEKQLDVFQKGQPELGLIYTGFIIVEENGKTLRVSLPEYRGWLYERILRTRDALTGAASVPMLKRECYDKVGLYDPKLKVSEDDELYMRVAKYFTWDFVPEVLVRIYLHGGYKLGGRIADQLESLHHRYALVEKELEKYPATKSSYLQQIGGLYCRLGNGREGRKWIWLAINSRRSNFWAWLQFLVSFLGRRFYLFCHKFYKGILKKGYAIPKYEDE